MTVPAAPPFAELGPVLLASALPVVVVAVAFPCALESDPCTASIAFSTRLPSAAAQPLVVVVVAVLFEVCVPVLPEVCVVLPPVWVAVAVPLLDPLASRLLVVSASAVETSESASAPAVTVTSPILNAVRRAIGCIPSVTSP
jgi:hypothetical protein